jgi:hypothetical protein
LVTPDASAELPAADDIAGVWLVLGSMVAGDIDVGPASAVGSIISPPSAMAPLVAPPMAGALDWGWLQPSASRASEIVVIAVADNRVSRLVRRFMLTSCGAMPTCNPDTFGRVARRVIDVATRERATPSVAGLTRGSRRPRSAATGEAKSIAARERGGRALVLVHRTAMIRRVAFAFAWVPVVVAGCHAVAATEVAPVDAGRTAIKPGHVVLADATDGPVAPVVRDALSRAAAGHRRLLVYVGASWCEPCQRFHRAAEQGQLDAAFPDLTLLVFDGERDVGRLKQAGYTSKYIPLFVLPNADGTSSGQQTEGGQKGDGAVAEITTRLQELLSR